MTGAAADIIALAGDGCDTAARPDPCRSVLPSVLYLATSWCKPAECIPHVPHTNQHEQNVPCHFVANVLATWDCITNEPTSRPINTRQVIICQQVGSGGPVRPKSDSRLGKLAGQSRPVQYWQQLPLLDYKWPGSTPSLQHGDIPKNSSTVLHNLYYAVHKLHQQPDRRRVQRRTHCKRHPSKTWACIRLLMQPSITTTPSLPPQHLVLAVHVGVVFSVVLAGRGCQHTAHCQGQPHPTTPIPIQFCTQVWCIQWCLLALGASTLRTARKISSLSVIRMAAASTVCSSFTRMPAAAKTHKISTKGSIHRALHCKMLMFAEKLTLQGW